MSQEYNKEMQKAMNWSNPYEYHFERGLYYHEVTRNLICGSQPRHAADVQQLAETEKVTHILNLQQDKDMQHWGVSLEDVRNKCRDVGIQHIRRPARDFDPHSLRKTLPSAVQAVHEALSNGGRVYVHCTAGLGRAPAVCIAYLFWFASTAGLSRLDESYKNLTDIRPCGPKRDAIRGATFDVLDQRHFDQFERLPKDAYAYLNDEDRFALQYRVLKGKFAS